VLSPAGPAGSRSERSSSIERPSLPWPPSRTDAATGACWEALAVTRLAIGLEFYVAGFDTRSQATEAWRASARGRPGSPAEQTAVAAGPQPGLQNCICLPPTAAAAARRLVGDVLSTISPPTAPSLLADLAPTAWACATRVQPSPTETCGCGSALRQPRKPALLRLRQRCP